MGIQLKKRRRNRETDDEPEGNVITDAMKVYLSTSLRKVSWLWQKHRLMD